MTTFYRAVRWAAAVSLLYVGSSGPVIRLVPTMVSPTWSAVPAIPVFT